MWIGLIDENGGDWLWVNGEPVSFSNWSSGKPTSYSGDMKIIPVAMIFWPSRDSLRGTDPLIADSISTVSHCVEIKP